MACVGASAASWTRFPVRGRPANRRPLRPSAGLFDFLSKPQPEKPQGRTWVDDVRDERKNGKGLKDAVARRARVKEIASDPAKLKAEKDRLRELRKSERYELGDKEPGLFGSIIIPMAPFGMPEYDEGERFDLKLPYVDQGYVDEDEDLGRKIGRLFGRK